MNYHVGRSGQQLGTFSIDEIRAKLASGEFRPDDLGWAEGMTDWKPLSELAPGVLPSFTAPTPPPIRAEAPRPLGQKPANNLVGAILVTLFCCLPCGIPAIIFASQVDRKYNAGDLAGAEAAAAKSKKWMWIGFTVGLIFSLIYFGLMAVGIATGAAEAGY